MNSLESVFFWLAAVLEGGAFFAAILGAVFGKRRSLDVAQGLLVAAALAVTVVGATRWIRTGHPPFVTVFESMLTSIWFLVVLFSILRWRAPRFALGVVPVSLVALLLTGWSSSLSQEASPLSAALTNVWLFVHASFATCGAATFLVAASLAGVDLYGPERLERRGVPVQLLPESRRMPGVIFDFLLFGLILWGVMIASGAIWAHNAWGRFWAWDPIEVWSLISWLLYALLIHARFTLGLGNRLFCALTIAAVLTVVFALWGVQYLYETIHTYG